MDVVTHMTAGALCADFGFRRKLGRKAYLFGALAGLFPDFDILLRFPFSSPLSLLIHRSFSHSLILFPFFSAVLAFGIMIYFRKKRKEILDFKPLWLLCLFGYFLHILFDLCNSYGTYIFWPINFTRYYLDLLPLIDPIFTSGLLLILFLSFKKDLRKPFLFFISWCVFYLSFLLLEHQIVKKEQNKIILGRGEGAVKKRIFPTSGNPFRWRSLYRTETKLFVDEVKSVPFFFPQIISGQSFFLAKEEFIQTSYLTRDEMIDGFKKFAHFSDGFIAFVPSRAAHLQTIGDFRHLKKMNENQTRTIMEFDKNSTKHPVVVRRNFK